LLDFAVLQSAKLIIIRRNAKPLFSLFSHHCPQAVRYFYTGSIKIEAGSLIPVPSDVL